MFLIQFYDNYFFCEILTTVFLLLNEHDIL